MHTRTLGRSGLEVSAFHIYNSGGHGWSMRQQGTTRDHWIDEFYWWLEAQGLTRPTK